MDDTAYDISYLLEQDANRTIVLDRRVTAPAAAIPATRRPSQVASVQHELAQELLQSAAVHEAMIEQYLRMAGRAGAEMPRKGPTLVQTLPHLGRT